MSRTKRYRVFREPSCLDFCFLVILLCTGCIFAISAKLWAKSGSWGLLYNLIKVHNKIQLIYITKYKVCIWQWFNNFIVFKLLVYWVNVTRPSVLYYYLSLVKSLNIKKKQGWKVFQSKSLFIGWQQIMDG